MKPTFKQETADIKEVISILQQKPEIDSKIKFYKDLFKFNENIVKAIDNKTSKSDIDEYDKAKLELEKFEILNKLEQQKKVFEMWLMRSKQYDEKFEQITKECEENFDLVYNEAVSISDANPLFKGQLEKYKNEDNDQRLKNEFYLFCKYEVQKIKAKSK